MQRRPVRLLTAPGGRFGVRPGRAEGVTTASFASPAPRRAIGRRRSPHALLAWIIAVCLVLAGQALAVTPTSAEPTDTLLDRTSTDRDFAAGSYIIDMGYGVNATTGVQSRNEGLQPYGLLYQLLVTEKIPVYWIIANGKTGQVGTAPGRTAADLTVDVKSPYTLATAASKSYYSGAFVIPAEFLTDLRLGQIITATGLTAVRVDKAVNAFEAPVFDKVTYFPRATLDLQNGSIAVAYYANAKIPATERAYVKKIPSQLSPCDDVYVMPHAEPEWSTHQRLLSWNLEEKGYIWAGCHAVSEMENLDSTDADLNPNMNFLSTEGLLSDVSHGDGSTPYYYGEFVAPLPWTSLTVPGTGTLASATADRSDPVMQFIGATETAHASGGAEQIYMPNPETKYPTLTGTTSRWNPGVQFVAWDPTQADVIAKKSPGVAAAAVYGRGFDDPNRGLVMYEGGHDLNKGTVGDTPAQRAFFNFLLLSGIESSPDVTVDVSNLPTDFQAGQSVPLSATLGGGSPAYSYTWQDNCGGTFSTPSGTAAGGTVSTTWKAPEVDDPTQCKVSVTVQDACGRQVFDAFGGPVLPLADVKITKTSNVAFAKVGTNFTYTLTATNDGPATAQGVVVTDTLPANVAYVSATGTPVVSADTRTLTWTIGSLAKNETRTFTVTVTAPAVGGVGALNTASVTSTTPDASPGNNTATVVTPIVDSGIEITKVARPAVVSDTGGSVTYEYVVTNTGSSPLTNVSVADNPTCSPLTRTGGDLDGDNVEEMTDALDPHEIWRYSCTRTVDTTTGDVGVGGSNPDNNSTTKSNVATVTAKDSTGTTLTAVATATVTISQPAIDVTKTLDPLTQTPKAGTSTVFSIKIKNTGNVV